MSRVAPENASLPDANVPVGSAQSRQPASRPINWAAELIILAALLLVGTGLFAGMVSILERKKTLNNVMLGLGLFANIVALLFGGLILLKSKFMKGVIVLVCCTMTVYVVWTGLEFMNAEEEKKNQPSGQQGAT